MKIGLQQNRFSLLNAEKTVTMFFDVTINEKILCALPGFYFVSVAVLFNPY